MTDNEKYEKAEKIRKTLDWSEAAMLGGLDHISVGKDVVKYWDRGMNGKTRDLSINVRKKTWRTIRKG